MFLSHKEINDIKSVIKSSGIKTNSTNTEYIQYMIIKKLLSEIEALKKKIKDME